MTRQFFTRLPSSLIPLKHHFVSPAVIDHCLNLLHTDPVSATHILIFGPPGTGKTSFAEGLAAKLRLPAFSITRDSDNTTRRHRAAI